MKIRKSSTKAAAWIPLREFVLGNSCKEDTLAFKEALLSQSAECHQRMIKFLCYRLLWVWVMKKRISQYTRVAHWTPQMCPETLANLRLLQKLFPSISLLSSLPTPYLLNTLKYQMHFETLQQSFTGYSPPSLRMTQFSEIKPEFWLQISIHSNSN